MIFSIVPTAHQIKRLPDFSHYAFEHYCGEEGNVNPLRDARVVFCVEGQLAKSFANLRDAVNGSTVETHDMRQQIGQWELITAQFEKHVTHVHTVTGVRFCPFCGEPLPSKPFKAACK